VALWTVLKCLSESIVIHNWYVYNIDDLCKTIQEFKHLQLKMIIYMLKFASICSFLLTVELCRLSNAELVKKYMHPFESRSCSDLQTQIAWNKNTTFITFPHCSDKNLKFLFGELSQRNKTIWLFTNLKIGYRLNWN
jgi:hypothetical protein